jgi:hypothetical protein
MTQPMGPKKAHNRVSAANLARMAQMLGRCGDIDPITGYVCVTQPHDADVMHMAVQIGGPRDGYVYHTWGGTLGNTGLIATQPTPKADD